MSFGRRRFLVSSSLTAAGLAVPLASLWSRQARARDYGDLVPDIDGILDLPAGFSYTVLEERSDPMDDGYVVPGRPDGMACFEGPDDTWILMRNHEVSAGDFSNGAYGVGQAPPEAYDANAYGGVTRVVIDATTLTRVSSNLVLTGTIRNCAGGPSPWGWLSCEENVSGDHGYVFACPIDAATVVNPDRIDGYGRYNHEAAAVDPATSICYLTEDRGDSAVYRFVPDDPADPFTGTLQALRVMGQDGLDTSTGLSVGDTLAIDWVDITDPTPVNDTVRDEAQAAGAATFSRGEGIWFHDGEVFIACTNGGPAGLGQIFRLVDGPRSGGIELIAQSEDSDVLDFPDNIAVAPWGQVFIAEDGDGDNYIRAITDTGDVVSFARNALSDSELAGVCFSPDGQALFVNIQGDGLTLMVTGPFPTDPGGSDETGTGDEAGETDDPDGSGTGGGTADGGTNGGATTGGEGSGGTAAGSGGSGGQDDQDGEGCGCSTSDDPSAGLAVAAGALVVGLHARRGPSQTED
ncbi:MAG: PhoX family protein [Deltaproteobacteria bacterium]|nr:PhoX family protein [Deltaproteobacteria bacterium]